MTNGKSPEWRAGADKLLETLARENKYIVSDMLIIFLEASGYALKDYSPVGGVFRRAASKGIISRIERPTKQALWLSKLYDDTHDVEITVNQDSPLLQHFRKGDKITLKGFGNVDGVIFQIAQVCNSSLRLERHNGI